MTISSKKEVLALIKDNRKGIAPAKELQKKVALFLKSHNTTSACFILGTDYSTLKKVSKGESVRDYIITRLEKRLADAKQNISL